VKHHILSSVNSVQVERFSHLVHYSWCTSVLLGVMHFLLFFGLSFNVKEAFVQVYGRMYGETS
jgi:hypothetical protein